MNWGPPDYKSSALITRPRRLHSAPQDRRQYKEESWTRVFSNSHWHIISAVSLASSNNGSGCRSLDSLPILLVVLANHKSIDSLPYFTYEMRSYKLTGIHQLASYTSCPNLEKNRSISERYKKERRLISEEDPDNMPLEINLHDKDQLDKQSPEEEVKAKSESISVSEHKPMKTGTKLSQLYKNIDE